MVVKPSSRAWRWKGVETIFGLPGGAILPVYDPIIDSPIRHILVRHEQGAGHMAEGFAHATGRPGVAMVTSGPGRHQHRDARWPTPTWTRSRWWSSPARWPTSALGTDAFQEADITGITMGVTKHNFLVTEAQDIPRTIREAFHIATTGRPGPVLVDVPKDIVDPKQPALGHGLVLARVGRPARLPPGDPRRSGPDPSGRRAHPGRRSARSSTPAAASSRPGRPRRCASWPSCATSTWSPR